MERAWAGMDRERVLRVVARLGVPLEAAVERGVPGTAERARAAASRVASGLAQGEVAVVRGASGSGKTLLLRALRAHVRAGGGWCVLVRGDVDASGVRGLGRARTPVGALVTGNPDAWLVALARAGLGEAWVLGRTVGELSAGERSRLGVALALWNLRRARRGGGRARAGGGGERAAWVLLDEFASVLDRAAARSLTLSLTRRARLEGVRLVLASAHDDVRDWAAPEVEVRLGLDGGVHLDGC